MTEEFLPNEEKSDAHLKKTLQDDAGQQQSMEVFTTVSTEDLPYELFLKNRKTRIKFTKNTLKVCTDLKQHPVEKK